MTSSAAALRTAPSHRYIAPTAVIFNNAGKWFPVQDVSNLDELYALENEITPLVNKITHAVNKAINKAIDGDQVTLPGPKDRNQAQRKVTIDLNGMETLICDVYRSRVSFNNPKALARFLDFENPDSPIAQTLAAFGADIVQLDNQFKEPHALTHYRSANTKIRIPIPDDPDGQTVIFELQVNSLAMDKCERQTHHHMEQARMIAERYPDQDIPNKAAVRMQFHYDQCKDINDRAARDAGLDDFLEGHIYQGRRITTDHKRNFMDYTRFDKK